MRMLVAAILAILFSSVAHAQEDLPAEVAAGVEEARKACEGKFTTEKGFVTRRDINGDGVVDFILDYDYAKCDEFESMFCGTGGCQRQVFVAIVDCKYRKILDLNAYSITFARRHGVPAMIQKLHGGNCGRSGGEGPCESVTYWNGEDFGPAYPLPPLKRRKN